MSSAWRSGREACRRAASRRVSLQTANGSPTVWVTEWLARAARAPFMSYQRKEALRGASRKVSRLAIAPVWSPDSKSILIFGSKRAKQGGPEATPVGWWCDWIRERHCDKLRLLDELQDQHLAPAEYSTATKHLMPIASSWTDGYMLFFRLSGADIKYLAATCVGCRVRSTGPAERLTAGTADWNRIRQSRHTESHTLIAFSSTFGERRSLERSHSARCCEDDR